MSRRKKKSTHKSTHQLNRIRWRKNGHEAQRIVNINQNHHTREFDFCCTKSLSGKKRKSPNQPGKLTFEWEFHDKSTDDDVDFCVRFSFAQYNFFGDFSSFTWLNALGREKKIFSISLTTNRRNHIKSQIHTITSSNTVRLKTRKKLFLFWFPRKYNRKKNPKLLIDIFFHKANARSRDSYSLSDACRSTKDWLTRAPLKQKKNHHHIKSVILTLSLSSPFSLLFVHIIVAAAALCCVLSVCSASYRSRLFYGGREDEGKHGWESERVSESGVGFM